MIGTETTIRVMLIDDHQTMIWGLTRLIESAGHGMAVVETASNCTDAIARIDHSAADVILLDLDLGGESAVNILPALMQRTNGRIIILTGERDPAVLDQCIVRGARGILRKDTSPELVVRAIEKVHGGEVWLDRETLGRVFGQMIGKPAARPDMGNEHACLTQKELRVIGALVKCGGLNNKELAKLLFVSEHTLRNHLTSIYQKLDVANRLELYVYACKHKLGLDEAPSLSQVKRPEPIAPRVC